MPHITNGVATFTPAELAAQAAHDRHRAAIVAAAKVKRESEAAAIRAYTLAKIDAEKAFSAARVAADVALAGEIEALAGKAS